jgi:hypothetical protein
MKSDALMVLRGRTCGRVLGLDGFPAPERRIRDSSESDALMVLRGRTH